MMPAEPVHVIYDGQCRLCRRALSVLHRLDLRKVIVSHDMHDRPTIETRFPALATLDLDEAMVVIARDKIYKGFDAFRRLVWLNPLTWLFVPLFYTPGSGFVGRRVYAWIARNRHRLGCGGGACLAPEGVGTGPAPTRQEPG